MTNGSTTNQQAKGPAFQWWMISNLAFGAGFSAFISLLIPPFVTDVTGNAADAGIIMAIATYFIKFAPPEDRIDSWFCILPCWIATAILHVIFSKIFHKKA